MGKSPLQPQLCLCRLLSSQAAAYNEMEITIIFIVTGVFLVAKLNPSAVGGVPVGPAETMQHFAVSLGFRLLTDFLTVFFASQKLSEVAEQEGFGLARAYDWHIRSLTGCATVAMTASFASLAVSYTCPFPNGNGHLLSLGICPS